MWLLENEEAFEGRRLWLRPGKTYLFGRTAAEPGQLAISHNTISRKHLTISLNSVEAGHAHHAASRSKVTIEDLATKIGTVVNGQKIKGSKYVVDSDEVEITMGKCPSKFRLTRCPVVFTFSFTNKELQTQPLTSLRERFEQLDIKLLTDYSVKCTTHVISKKRNTAKGLQALINGKYIVTETFLDAITSVAEPPQDSDGLGSSPLEQDFDRYWPNPLEHLPPRGGEPVQHPDLIYTPELGRKDVFEGYTFIFYDKTQYNNLLAPITNGCGKAMLHTVNPGETQVDDFVRYVKEVAGEKGLGRFDDGSEGKGVVLVRYLPAKGDLVTWYTEFITAVSLRLDHRPIEQNEFLEAILIKDASKLRRPLEVESAAGTQEARHPEISDPLAAAPPQSNADSQTPRMAHEPSQESQPTLRRGIARKPVKRRFAGFDDDEDDIDMDEPPPPAAAAAATTQHVPPQVDDDDDEGGLFVSQEPNIPQEPARQDTHNVVASRSQRKRPASPLPEDDLMEGMAPAVAKFKRQRLEFTAAPSPEPEEEPAAPSAPAVKVEPKKKAKELDVLAVAAKNREEAEARSRAEQEDLANLPEGIDLAEIRRLNIVEEMEVRVPERHRAPQRTRDQDVADGRWNPKWNGVKNFKKFRRRGEVVGRQPARVIIALAEVKTKEFGVGDNYWLEDGDSPRRKASVLAAPGETPLPPPEPSPRKRAGARVVVSESSENDDADDGESNDGEDTLADTLPAESAPTSVSARQASSRGGGTQLQRSTRSQASGGQSQAAASSQGKRAAATRAAAGRSAPPAKRPRATPKIMEVADSDGSDDELKFRFGKRR